MLLGKLKLDTAEWKGTITPENYTTGPSSNRYTIDYSAHKARLITATEVAKIVNYKSWNETLTSSTSFYFDTLTTSSSATCKSGNTSECKYGWLYDRTSKSCTNYGCLNNSDVTTSGYWTVSSNVNTSDYAWYVEFSACMEDQYVSSFDDGDELPISIPKRYGVRPVITVYKASL